ncbi:MAG TPA: DUF5522 domain-containing protein [Cyclobacteriaceae bacterium]
MYSTNRSSVFWGTPPGAGTTVWDYAITFRLLGRKKTIRKNNSPSALYYIEQGYVVYTAVYHLQRGYCCKNGCRHCPWKEGNSKPGCRTP